MSDDPLEELDYYTLLGVAEDIPVSELKTAFRRFARKYHPDRFAGASTDKVERAARIYRRGSEAFQVLSNDSDRKLYDRLLHAGKMRLSSDDRVRVVKKQPERKRLPAHIRHPKARAYHQKALQFANQGHWINTWKAMKLALQIEPDNAYLKAQLDQVERRLRSKESS